MRVSYRGNHRVIRGGGGVQARYDEAVKRPCACYGPGIFEWWPGM